LSTCFEPRGFILRETAVYAVWYVLHASVLAFWWVGEGVREPPLHRTAHIDACKTYHTAHTTVSLRMNPRVSKHVAENGNKILIYKIVHVVGLCSIIVSQCTVQKNLKLVSIVALLFHIKESSSRTVALETVSSRGLLVASRRQFSRYNSCVPRW
jgi:hypothetical protein